MAVVLTDAYKLWMAREVNVFHNIGGGSQQVKYGLFTNNITPTSDTVVSDLDLLISGGSNDDFLGNPALSGNDAYQDWDVQSNTYTNSTGADVTIYGWCIYEDAFSDTLIFAELLTTPIVIPDGATRTISTQLRVTISS